MSKITPDMTVFEVLKLDENTAPIFLDLGMHCLGCPSARNETVGQAALKHGVSSEELVDRLNEYFASKA